MKTAALKGLARFAGPGTGGRILSSLVGAVVRTVHPRKDVALENLSRVFPDSEARWREALLKRHYGHLAMSVVEFLALSRDPGQALSWVGAVEGEENLEYLRGTERGAVILTGHLGNWELLSAWLCGKEVPLAAVVQRNQDPELEAFIEGTRKRAGLETISKSFGMRGAVKALRQGKVLGLLMDQHGGDLTVPFFGCPARTFGGGAAFARLGGVPVVPVFAYREGLFRHRIVIRPPLALPEGLETSEYIRTVTLRCNSILEEAILRCPEQWLWLHRRWRQRIPR
jgi:KDO2-lipid IV(A) lauroyltransferase